MRIDTLRVKSFRCFEDSFFRFHRGFNCIIGENGAGKTALLDAIAIAMDAWLLGVPRHDGNRPIRYWRRIDRSDIRRIYLQSENRKFDTRFSYPVVITATGEVFGQPNQQWSRGRSLGPRAQNDVSHIKELGEQAVIALNRFDKVTLPLLSYYGTSRLIREQYETLNDPEMVAEAENPLHGYRAAIDPRWNSKELSRWLLRQQWIAFQEGKPSAVYPVVKDAILQCLEGAKNIDFIVASGMAMVEFESAGWRPLSELSDGQRNIFAMIGDIAQKAAVLNPHLDENALKETPGIVLIDELDLHLHPEWQRRIVNNLQRVFPNIQFFVTTHSPQIISEVEAEKLIVLKQNGEVEAVKQSYGFDSNSILRRIMRATARPEPVQNLINAAEELIDNDQFPEARATLGQLREILNGEDAEVAGLEASLNTLEALAE